jgi:hypothetical protein
LLKRGEEGEWKDGKGNDGIEGRSNGRGKGSEQKGGKEVREKERGGREGGEGKWA